MSLECWGGGALWLPFPRMAQLKNVNQVQPSQSGPDVLFYCVVMLYALLSQGGVHRLTSFDLVVLSAN